MSAGKTWASVFGPVPQAGRSPAGGQWIWPPPCGAGAQTAWMLVFFKFFFTINIILQRSHSYKAFPNHYNHWSWQQPQVIDLWGILHLLCKAATQILVPPDTGQNNPGVGNTDRDQIGSKKAEKLNLWPCLLCGSKDEDPPPWTMHPAPS